MTVTNITKDPSTLTMVVTANFTAPAERVWQVLADPRQLEKWWGPPTYPATVEKHDLRPGGEVTYYMTSPEGDQFHGWWRVINVEPPHRLEVEDGFANEDGSHKTDMPTTLFTVSLSEEGEGTRMDIHTKFPSLEAMQQMSEMGMEEGMREALGQVDALLAT
jgi:uncharacterized protein YndB with AHSA1/START domain